MPIVGLEVSLWVAALALFVGSEMVRASILAPLLAAGWKLYGELGVTVTLLSDFDEAFDWLVAAGKP